MRVSREQAAANRERVVATAARLYRERGLEGVGLDQVMREAGLTHGAFYGQFDSKQDLVAEACGRAVATSAERWAELIETLGPRALPAMLDRYLGTRHRDGPGGGCIFSALGAEAGRQGPALRRLFGEGLERLLGLLAQALPSGTRRARRQRALAAMAEMVGAQVLARAVADEGLSREILQAVRDDLGRRLAA